MVGIGPVESASVHRLSGRGKTIELGRRTLVMGILNVTPDSFSDGGHYPTAERAAARAEEMVREGADLIDVGGESTRPAGPYGEGASAVSLDEEIGRTIPVIEKLAGRIDTPISIDTTKAEVAQRAVEAGASLVNDISALRFDPAMGETVAAAGVPVVLMHMKGTPKTMQQAPAYRDLIGEIKDFLSKRASVARDAGIAPDRIVVDPGLGFGKQIGHNFEIIGRLREFSTLGLPLLVGPSRKGFAGAALKLPPEKRLEGTLAALALCVSGGAHILRVHDVGAAVRALAVADAVVRSVPPPA